MHINNIWQLILTVTSGEAFDLTEWLGTLREVGHGLIGVLGMA